MSVKPSQVPYLTSFWLSADLFSSDNDSPTIERLIGFSHQVSNLSDDSIGDVIADLEYFGKRYSFWFHIN